MLDNPFAGQAGAGGFGGFGGQSAGAQGGFRWEDIKDQFGDGEAFGGGRDKRRVDSLRVLHERTPAASAGGTRTSAEMEVEETRGIASARLWLDRCVLLFTDRQP